MAVAQAGPRGSNLATLGMMGLVMIAPEAHLPTFSQSVQGLGAVAAGMVLASMSIGWPAASALSGRLYMRVGFRDAALAGAGLLILASLGFLWMPEPQAAWAVVLDQVALGAGFGLLSTPRLVGEQSVVGWDQRGVTGANLFARYLGQSLGAAIFGARSSTRRWRPGLSVRLRYCAGACQRTSTA